MLAERHSFGNCNKKDEGAEGTPLGPFQKGIIQPPVPYRSSWEEYDEAELFAFMNRLIEAEVGNLRYRLFEMGESNKNWVYSGSALERENQALKSQIEKLCAQNEKPAAWWEWLKRVFRW